MMTSQHYNKGPGFFPVMVLSAAKFDLCLTMTCDDVVPVMGVTDSTFSLQLFLTELVDVTYIVNLSCCTMIGS